MKLKSIFILLSFCFFKIQSMDFEQWKKIFTEDDVQAIDIALNTGLNVNHLIFDVTPLLFFALLSGAEKIVVRLIEKGANVNLCQENQQTDSKVSPLLVAFCNSNCSLNTCKTLINNGANIFGLYVSKKPLFGNRKIKTIFDVLNAKKVSFEKKQFITQYLIGLYDKQVLEIALSKKCPFKGIVLLIENGAYIPSYIIDLAKKFKSEKKIINFLQYQIGIKNQILQNETLKEFHAPVVDLIHSYSYGIKDGDKVVSKNEIMLELLAAIQRDDFQSIEYYLKNKGNPNLKIKFERKKATLLCCALAKGKEVIAKLLLCHKANVNLKADDGRGRDISALYFALENDNISLDLVKELLDRGADINNVIETEIFYNLTTVLSMKWTSVNNNEKIKFIIDYLLKLFGDKVLNYIVADKNASIDIIKHFTKLGAKANQETLEIAMKTELPANVIKYLQSIIQLNEMLLKSNIEMPFSVIDTINDFNDDFESKEMPESHKCIIS